MPSTRTSIKVQGTTGVLLIDPGADDAVTCTLDFVSRAKLIGYGPRNLGRVGSVVVTGAQAEFVVTIDGRPMWRTIQWTGLPYPRTADCVAGPRVLGRNVVKFVLGGVRADARLISLPFSERDKSRAYGVLAVGKAEVDVRFELSFARTLLTATAAHAIAPALGETATGDVTMENITNGVSRPVRRLDLNRPFVIGAMRIRDPYVRVVDYGRAVALRTLADGDEQPGDVVVGSARTPSTRSRLVRVGRDDALACVSLTFDYKRKAIDLLC